jgi:hypothetical protein
LKSLTNYAGFFSGLFLHNSAATVEAAGLSKPSERVGQVHVAGTPADERLPREAHGLPLKVPGKLLAK